MIVRAEQVGRVARCGREAWYRARGERFMDGASAKRAARLLDYGVAREAAYFRRVEGEGRVVGGAVWLILAILILVLVALALLVGS